MPCYRCGVRQVDPVRGHSPWQRGVRDDQQVLVCPVCQAERDWTRDLDQCRECGSARLVRRLGEVECRDCGLICPPAGAHTAAAVTGPVGAGGAKAGEVAPPEEAAPGGVAGDGMVAGGGGAGTVGGPGAVPGCHESPGREGPGPVDGLSEEVARALERVLGRSRLRLAPAPAGQAPSG